MAVCRVEKNKNYTTMSNYHLRDPNLSNKARGLLSTMLSLPDNWDYTTRGLARICKDGVDGITAQLKELDKAKSAYNSAKAQYDEGLAAYNKLTKAISDLEDKGVPHIMALTMVSASTGQVITDDSLAEMKSQREKAARHRKKAARPGRKGQGAAGFCKVPASAGSVRA